MYQRVVAQRMYPYDTRLTPQEIPSLGVFSLPTRTVCVNVEWCSHILGVLDRLAWEDAWIGTDEEIQEAIQEVYKLMIAFSLGCCAETPIFRYTPEGTLEQSVDGGVTWTPAPLSDPRISAPLFPQLPGTPGNTMKCQAADNMVDNLTQQVTEYAEDLLQTGTQAGIVVAIGEAVALFIGVFAPYTLAVIALGAALIEAGSAAVSAAFDEDVWDRLRCNIYCHIADDGTVSQAAYAAIQSQILDDETGLTQALLFQMMNTLGVAGMTNAGRVGNAAGTDCSSCGCDCTEEVGYPAETENYTGGTVGANGPYAGRFLDPGGSTTLTIPDRAGRNIVGVFVWISGASGSGTYIVSAGGTDSDESPVTRTGLEDLTHTWSTPQNTDTITLELTGTLAVHLRQLTVFYDC